MNTIYNVKRCLDSSHDSSVIYLHMYMLIILEVSPCVVTLLGEKLVVTLSVIILQTRNGLPLSTHIFHTHLVLFFFIYKSVWRFLSHCLMKRLKSITVNSPSDSGVLCTNTKKAFFYYSPCYSPSS